MTSGGDASGGDSNAAPTCAAAAADESPAAASAALQEALGITTNGTCLRHVNCPVLNPKNNTIMSCRVCFSEEKSVGIRQRKSFAAVVNQLHRMGSDQEEEGKTAEGSGTAAANSDSSASMENASTASAPLFQHGIPPNQSLESIMKRLAQVQNWMLRQKEKEVLSLQLTIHRLEQRLNDQDTTVADQKETIRQLRRTIQQDLKIIKTMATQKERELEAEHALKQQQQLLAATENDGDDDDDDDEEEDAAAIMYESPVRTMKKVKAGHTGAPSPIENRLSSPPKRISVGSPSSVNSDGGSAEGPPPMEKFAKRRGKKNLVAEGNDGNGSPTNRQQKAPPMRRAPARRPSSDSIDVSVTIPEDDVLDDDDGTADFAGDDHSQPSEIFVHEGKNPRSSEYWSDEDLTFANDPSKIFASFRGGLLDIPKSPPPAHHNREKQKLKLKVKLDQEGKMALKLPSMRHIGRNLSGVSTATAESLDTGGMPGAQGQSGIPLNLLAAQLQTLPSLDHSTHTQQTNQYMKSPGSLLNTPGSMIGDESPSPTSKVNKQSSEPQPPPPPLSLLGGTDDEGDEEDLLNQNISGGPAPAIPTHVTTTNSVPERVTLSAVLGQGKSDSKNDEEASSKPSLVSATYSLESLELDAKSKDGGENGPMASASSLAGGGGGSTLPTLMERMNESTADINNDETSNVFSVTRASCQDRYGDPGIYTGTILVTEGLPNGHGTMNYESGRIYEGEWLSGHWNGKGSLLNPNGDTYEGEFVFDSRHGHGTYKWDNGDIYVGNFSQDKRHGKGKFSFHNGNVYEGEFVDGMFEGFGKYVFADGSYEGEWKQGRYEGQGELKYASGGMYTGEFRNSVAHGFGLEIAADGTKRRGVWVDGKPAEHFDKNSASTTGN